MRVLTFIQTASFVAQFRRLRLDDDDLRTLERVLMDNPAAGKVMARTGGVRKLRFAPAAGSRGKSGSLRVCYSWFPRYDAIGLYMIYAKNERDTLSAEDEKLCRLLTQRMELALQKG